MRIERAPQELHDVHVVIGEHPGHVLLLVLPDAVLPGERPTVLQAGEDDLAGQLLGFLGLALGVVVVEYQGMQITVPGVEDVGDPQAVAPGELGDLAKDCGELRARDDTVLDIVVVGDATHGPESGLAGLPEEGAFVVVLGHPDLGCLVLLTDLQHPSELFLYLSFRAIQLYDQDGAGVGQPRMHGRLDGFHGQAVHHLDGGGDYPLADDPRDRTAGTLGAFEGSQQGSHRLRDAAQPERDPGGDTQRPLRADESAEQIVARRVRRPATPDVRHRAVRQHDLGAHDVVRGKAVLQAVDAAGVLGQVAADGRDDLACRVWSVVVALVGDLLAHPHVDDARLDHDALVRDVHLKNLAHPGEHDQNARLDRQGPAREAGPRAAGNKGNSLIVAELDYPLDVFAGLGEDDEVGDDAVVHQAVALVGAQLLVLVDHALRAHDAFHLPYEPATLHVYPPWVGSLSITPLSRVVRLPPAG